MEDILSNSFIENANLTVSENTKTTPGAFVCFYSMDKESNAEEKQHWIIS